MTYGTAGASGWRLRKLQVAAADLGFASVTPTDDADREVRRVLDEEADILGTERLTFSWYGDRGEPRTDGKRRVPLGKRAVAYVDCRAPHLINLHSRLRSDWPLLRRTLRHEVAHAWQHFEGLPCNRGQIAEDEADAYADARCAQEDL